MSNVNVRLYGGLGNQVFQMSAAIFFAKKCNVSTVYYDDTGLGGYSVARNNNIELFFDFSRMGINLIRKRSCLHSLRLAKLLPFSRMLVSDKNFLRIIRLNCSSSTYFDGYFQDCIDHEIFNQHIKLLKQCLKEYAIVDGISKCCVIHIRGGDFVKLGWNVVSPKSYYESAISCMINNFDIKNFDVITDDEVYAKELLGGIGINFNLVGSSIVDDFFRIGDYPYRIISSSTFAFWASSLGRCPDPVVIAPTKWTPTRARNILLPGEIRI